MRLARRSPPSLDLNPDCVVQCHPEAEREPGLGPVTRVAFAPTQSISCGARHGSVPPSVSRVGRSRRSSRRGLAVEQGERVPLVRRRLSPQYLSIASASIARVLILDCCCSKKDANTFQVGPPEDRLGHTLPDVYTSASVSSDREVGLAPQSSLSNHSRSLPRG